MVAVPYVAEVKAMKLQGPVENGKAWKEEPAWPRCSWPECSGHLRLGQRSARSVLHGLDVWQYLVASPPGCPALCGWWHRPTCLPESYPVRLLLLLHLARILVA